MSTISKYQKFECGKLTPLVMMESRVKWNPNSKIETAPNCPRCNSSNTKFCYYNNYSVSQPRYLCKSCRRYWTKGGSLRNVPVGGGCRKGRRHMSAGGSSSTTTNNNNNNTNESAEREGTDDSSSNTKLDLMNGGDDRLQRERERFDGQDVVVYKNDDEENYNGFDELENILGTDDHNLLWSSEEGANNLPSFGSSQEDFEFLSNVDDDPLTISSNYNLVISDNWGLINDDADWL